MFNVVYHFPTHIQVYLLKGSQCPSMLKDLLQTPQIKDIFGPTVVSDNFIFIFELLSNFKHLSVIYSSF